MTSIAVAEPVTPEEFLRLDGNYELVGGRLEERNVSVESTRVAARILRLLGNFAEENALGDVYGSDLMVRAFRDPGEVRKPGIAFVSSGRVPEGDPEFLNLAPDLIVDVVSPAELAYDVHARTNSWLGAGVRLQWVVWPHLKLIDVCRADGSREIVRQTATITGEDVLPGFAITVSELFVSDIAAARSSTPESSV